jgi:glycine cleavage system H protein
LSSKQYELPDDLLYTTEHEWAKVISAKEVVVGITSYAADQLHDVVYVELPALGSRQIQGKTACSVESVKSTSDVTSPFSGIVVQVNESLLQHPEKVNQSPYGEGWFFKLEPSDLDSEKGNLMNSTQYTEFIKKLIEQS